VAWAGRCLSPRSSCAGAESVHRRLTSGREFPGSGVPIQCLVFRCKATGGALATSDEVAYFRWASETEVAELADEVYASVSSTACITTAPQRCRAHGGMRLLSGNHPRYARTLTFITIME
jgi:hypothetical protein